MLTLHLSAKFLIMCCDNVVLKGKLVNCRVLLQTEGLSCGLRGTPAPLDVTLTAQTQNADILFWQLGFSERLSGVDMKETFVTIIRSDVTC